MDIIITPPFYEHLMTRLGAAFRSLRPNIESVAHDFAGYSNVATLVVAQHCSRCAGSEKHNKQLALPNAVVVCPVMALYLPEEGVTSIDCLPPPEDGAERWQNAAPNPAAFLARWRWTIDLALSRAHVAA